jgi:hypothetical protein
MPDDEKLETTTQLCFPVWRVRRLMRHATRCADHMGLDGVQAAAPGPGLVLVADTAVYLASNGVDGTPLNGVERVAFAEGFEADGNVEADIRRIAGQEDAAVFIKVEDLDMVLHRCRDVDDLAISVTHDGKRLTKVLLVPPLRGTFKNLPEEMRQTA